MKEFSQIVHGKGLFVSIKGHLCLTKDHLANPEGQVEIEFLHWKLFLTLLNQIKKKIKIKRALFNQASDPRMLYPSRIDSDHQDLPWLHGILLIYTIRNHLDCLFCLFWNKVLKTRSPWHMVCGFCSKQVIDAYIESKESKAHTFLESTLL